MSKATNTYCPVCGLEFGAFSEHPVTVDLPRIVDSEPAMGHPEITHVRVDELCLRIAGWPRALHMIELHVEDFAAREEGSK